MDLTTDALIYEALFRYFRNAIVDHVRMSLCSAFPDDFSERIRRPFREEEWNGAVASAEAARRLGYVSREHRDDFDYLGINHFYNVFENYFVELMPAEEMPPPEYRSKVKQQLLGWLRELKGIRDPVAHPAADEISPSGAVRVVDSAWRVLTRLHLSQGAAKVLEIHGVLVRRASAAASPDPLQGALDDTLPPAESIVVDFIGRDDELAQLWGWFLGETSNRWMLSGDGGKGKSAIAFKFATDARATKPENLCGVYWLSAKRRRFDEGEIHPTQGPDFWDLDSALNKLLSDYGWGEQTGSSIDAKRTTVLSLLEDFPALVVVDDLDSIPPDEEDVVEFFTLHAPRARSKILMTSRRLFAGMGKSCTSVQGLPADAAADFIRSREALLGLPENMLNDARRREVSSICEGSPLYMEDLLRLCKFLPFNDALRAWRSAQGEEVRRYALQREVELLSAPAREILQVCALAEHPLTLLELQRVTGRGEEAALAAVDELRRMYLVPAPELIEEVPRFQVNRNLALLLRTTIDSSQELRLMNALLAMSGGSPGPSIAKTIGDHCRQARVLVGAARFHEAEETMNAGLARHPNNPKLLGMLGWVYWRSNPARRADARKAWKRAFELGATERAMYLNWSTMEAEEEQWEWSIGAAERGLERVSKDDARLLQAAGYARSRFGQSLISGMHQDRGMRELDQADRVLQRAVHRAQVEELNEYDISRSFRSWVLNAQWRGSTEDLCERLVEWLAWDRNDPQALREARLQQARCPEVASYVAASGPA